MNKVIKKRTVRLSPNGSESFLEELLIAFSSLDGIISTEVVSSTKVRIEYDLLQIRFNDILLSINATEQRVPVRGFYRIVVGWINFLEQNESDSYLASPSPCCSNPVDISRRAKKRN